MTICSFPAPVRHFAWFFLLLLLCAPLAADESKASPAINRQYQDPDWQQWVTAFENPGRELYARRHDIVAALGLRAGMAVADIGAGTGLFTRLFARQVAPQGRVYAVDISKTFIDNILRTCREQGIGNVTGIVNSQRDTGLAGNSVDLVFLADTYHHFENPQAMLASIQRALRTAGRLVIIDFRREPGFSSPWVMQHVRAGQETVVREITAAGFRLEADTPLLRSNYFLLFSKRAQ